MLVRMMPLSIQVYNRPDHDNQDLPIPPSRPHRQCLQGLKILSEMEVAPCYRLLTLLSLLTLLKNCFHSGYVPTYIFKWLGAVHK